MVQAHHRVYAVVRAMGQQDGNMDRSYERKTEWQKEDTEWDL